MPQNDLRSLYANLKDKIVLNVDDNEMNHLVLSKILHGVGIVTIQAGNGAEAIKKLQEGLKPDVILMDLEMPVLNGVQTSEYIRTHLDPNLLIIINSGVVSGYHRYRLQHLNIQDFLEKPYNLHDIFSKLSKCMSTLHA